MAKPPRTVAREKVRKALRRYGFRPVSRGNGSGHEVWIDPAGRRTNPVLRHRDVSYAYLYSLALSLEGQGICTRTAFLQQLKNL